jgi:hypothetical protein
MSQVWGNRDDIFFRLKDEPDTRHDLLPTGTYLLVPTMEGIILKVIPDFKLPKRVYGNVMSRADRILNTFEDRPNSTGVLLSGDKGSGKTLLTKSISLKGIKRGYPTLLVNAPLCGDAFNVFIQEINQPAVVLFDEFEKVYSKEEQQRLLTLFDGIFPSQKLFLLTANDSNAIETNLHNRPGRVYYSLDFKGLDHEFIREYGEENLKDRKHLSGLSVVASMIPSISFDSLQAIVEETNRSGESPVEVLNVLNVKYINGGWRDEYEVVFVPTDEKYKNGMNLTSPIRTNPFGRVEVEFYYDVPKKVRKNQPVPKDSKSLNFNEIMEKEQEYAEVHFESKHLTRFDAIEGVYDYESEKGTLRLTRSQPDKRSHFEKYGDKSVTY